MRKFCKACSLMLPLLIVGISTFPKNSTTIDSLMRNLPQSAGEQKVKILSDLCWEYLPISIDSAILYGQQAVSIATGLSNAALEAQARNDFGTALLLKGNLDAAIGEYREGLKIRTVLNDIEGIASIQLKLGNCYYKAGKLDSAMYQFTSALAYFEKANKPFETAQVQGNIGALYYTMANYSKAVEYHTRSASLLESLKRYYELANTQVNIGNTYLRTGDTANGTIHYRKAIEISNASNNRYAESAALNNLGNIAIAQRNFDEAIAFARHSIRLRQSMGMDGEQASAQTTLGIAYNATGRFDEALDQLRQALPIAEAGQLTEQLISIYMQKAIAYGGLRQPDSMQSYLTRYEGAKNKFTANEMLKASAELETKYQTAQKDAALEKSMASLRYRNLALGTISVLLVLSIIIALLFFKQQKLRARTRQMALLNEQRMHISRELHDNIGTYLNFIKNSVDDAGTDAEQQVPLEDIRQLTEETIAELRKTVWLMNNPAISLSAFNAKLIDFYKKIAPVRILQPAGHPNLVLGTRVATQLFRIIQESVTNALKHANPTEVQVHLQVKDHFLCAEVKDNGNGMDESQSTSGAGLNNLRERVKELGGNLSIESHPDTGTLLRFSIPLLRNNA